MFHNSNTTQLTYSHVLILVTTIKNKYDIFKFLFVYVN